MKMVVVTRKQWRKGESEGRKEWRKRGNDGRGEMEEKREKRE